MKTTGEINLFYNSLSDYVIYATIALTLGLSASLLIRRFRLRPVATTVDGHEFGLIPLLVTSLAVAAAVGSLLLAPFTIISACVLLHYDGVQAPRPWFLGWLHETLVQTLWSGAFWSSQILLFWLLPFAYFYCESPDIVRQGSRLMDACAVSAALLVALFGSLFFGASLATVSLSSASASAAAATSSSTSSSTAAAALTPSLAELIRLAHASAGLAGLVLVLRYLPRGFGLFVGRAAAESAAVVQFVWTWIRTLRRRLRQRRRHMYRPLRKRRLLDRRKQQQQATAIAAAAAAAAATAAASDQQQQQQQQQPVDDLVTVEDLMAARLDLAVLMERKAAVASAGLDDCGDDELSLAMNELQSVCRDLQRRLRAQQRPVSWLASVRARLPVRAAVGVLLGSTLMLVNVCVAGYVAQQSFGVLVQTAGRPFSRPLDRRPTDCSLSGSLGETVAVVYLIAATLIGLYAGSGTVRGWVAALRVAGTPPHLLLLHSALLLTVAAALPSAAVLLGLADAADVRLRGHFASRLEFMQAPWFVCFFNATFLYLLLQSLLPSKLVARFFYNKKKKKL